MIIFENSLKSYQNNWSWTCNHLENQNRITIIFFFFSLSIHSREIGKIMGTSGWADAAGNKYSWNRIDHRAGDRRKNHPSSNFTIRHQIDSHEVFDEMTNNGETEDENHRWMIAHVRIPDENWTSIWDECYVCVRVRARVCTFIYICTLLTCMLVCELVSWRLKSWSCSIFFM